MVERYNSLSDFGKAHGIPQSNAPAQAPRPSAPTSAKTPESDFFAADFDYVAKAETVINSLRFTDRNGKHHFGKFTTSKIRNILSLVNQIGSEVHNPVNTGTELGAELANKIRYIKVRLAYEAGREPDVKKFLEKSGLLEVVDNIGSDKQRFVRFEKYLEALVAYHRYLGGKDY